MSLDVRFDVPDTSAIHMTPEAQRIALAEFEGYSYNAPNKSWPNPYWTEPIGKQLLTLSELPDYLNDLNSVHRLEKRLIFTQMMDFIPHIRDITHRDKTVYVSATAPQRCEALLKTLGLWKE